MSQYQKFAAVYDRLTQDVDYEQMASFIHEIIKSNKNRMVLDLACGTGSLSQKLSKLGYDLIGVDLSEEMLMTAREKLPNVLFLNQSMQDFELYGTVGAIVCMLDSFNYLTEDGELSHTLQLCNNYLEPNGYLIFDINSPYKFENVYDNQVYTYDDGDIFYVWENAFYKDEKICDFYLTFFVKTANGQFEKFTEQHAERMYETAEIATALHKNGFEICNIIDGDTYSAVTPETQRFLYVCKNIDAIQAKHAKK